MLEPSRYHRESYGVFKHGATHEARAANLLHLIDRSQKLREKFTLSACVREESLPLDLIKGRESGRAHNSAPAEGRAVIARTIDRRVWLISDTGAERKPIRNPLRGGKDIGLDAKGLKRPPRAGTADTSLNLVKDEGNLGSIAQLSETAEELGGRWNHAPFPLNRLDEDASD